MSDTTPTPATPNSKRHRRWLIIPPVAVGVAIFAWSMSNRRGLEKRPPQEIARVVRVIAAPQIPVVPRVIGYGTARPEQSWRAVAEVGGTVIEIHDQLRAGMFLRTGEVALQIDPREYELEVARLEGEIAQVHSQLNELTTRDANERESLAIEKASLELAQADLERLRGLFTRDQAAPVELRNQERTWLAQKQKVQSIENSLNLMPAQRTTLEATLAAQNARLDRARLDLAKTAIKVPFDCRLGLVQIEQGQYVKPAELLFEIDGADVTEIDVQVPIDRMPTLLAGVDRTPIDTFPSMDMVRERLNLTAVVRLPLGDHKVEWPARFVRVREMLDPTTRTVGIVVAVDKPYERAIPGERPPLVRGAYCEVELRAAAIPSRIIVPRSAVVENAVYIADGANRLRRRDVSVLFAQTDFVCIASGIEPGERVIVTDPVPAIEGMLLDPVSDDTLLAQMTANATGEGSAR